MEHNYYGPVWRWEWWKTALGREGSHHSYGPCGGGSGEDWAVGRESPLAMSLCGG